MILFYISMSYILECVYELCYYKCDKLNERSQIMSQLTCTVCHTYFESKRADTKCCSAKCRKKASRAKDSVGPAEIVVVDTGGMPKGLSETDRLFYLDTLHMGPEWMKFSEESESRVCFICKSRYATKLRFLKFCRPECQGVFLHGQA